MSPIRVDSKCQLSNMHISVLYIMNGRSERHLRFSFIFFSIFCVLSTTYADSEQVTKIKGKPEMEHFG